MWNNFSKIVKNLLLLKENSEEISNLKKEIVSLKIKQASFETFQRIFENSLEIKITKNKK